MNQLPSGLRVGSYNLRLLQASDGSAYHRLVKNNKSRIYAYFPRTIQANETPTKSIDFVHNQVEKARQGVCYTFVLTDPESNEISAVLFLKDIDWHTGKAELGFFTDHQHQGKGLMTKAVALLLDQAFEGFKLNKIYMRVAPENIASNRVAIKNGFTNEGTIRADFKTTDGRLIDVIYYGKLASDR